MGKMGRSVFSTFSGFLLSVCTQETVADIVFLVDGSTSIGETNFQQIREFISSLVEKFEVAPDRIRIGLVQYSDTPYTEFSLSTYQNKEEILSYIQNLHYKTGGTHTGKGLEFMLKQHFVEKAGSRAQQNVPQIAIVITDGDSQDEVESQAQDLRQRGIKIFVIEIKDANKVLLRKIASEPYDQHAYSVSDFAALQGISQSVIRKVCTAVEEAQKEPKFADFFILVDSSASRQEQQIIKKFLSRLIQQLNVGNNTNRVSLAQFSENVKEEFLLNTDKTKNEILSYIQSLTLRPTGERRIGNAIEYAHKNFFSNVSGSRVSEGFKQFLLVVSAGESADGVVQASRTIKTDAVTVFAVGLNKADVDEMKYISKFKILVFLNSHVFLTECMFDEVADIAFIVDQSGSIRSKNFQLVRNFLKNTIGGLDVGDGKIKIAVVLYSDFPRADVNFNTSNDKTDILRYIRSMPYGRGKTNTGAALKFAKEHVNSIKDYFHRRSDHFMNFLFLGCEGLFADVVFLLDGSGSISAKDFENMKDIMKLVIDKFEIGLDKEHVAVVQYGTDPKEEFSLNTFNDKAVLLQEIRNIKQMNGKANTGKALKEVLQSFDISKGGRCSALKFLIVLTDGESSDDVAEPAKMLRDNFININAIGMRHADKSQILAIAGSRDGSHDGAFFEDRFTSPKDLSNAIIPKICNTACKTQLIDIIFLVDAGSSNKDGFQEMINLMKYVVSKSVVGEKRVRFGGITYSDNPRLEFTLKQYDRQIDILRVISNLKASGGSRNTVQALNYALSYFGETHGGRPAENVPQVLFLITDGPVNDLSGLATWLESLAKSNVIFFAIGTEDADVEQLKEMVGYEGTAHYAKTYQDLCGLQKQVSQELCKPSKSYSYHHTLNTLVHNPRALTEEISMFSRFLYSTYSDNPRLEFTLKQYDRQIDILRVISNLKASGGSRNTVQALNYALSYFGETHGGRPAENVPQVLFLITDGPVNDLSGLATWLESLAKSNVIFFAIGTEDADVEQLKEMVGYEGTAHYAKTYQDLCGLQKQVSQELCKPICEKTLSDLVFLIDGSDSIQSTSWNILKKTMIAIVRELDIAQDKWRVGVAQFSDIFQRHFYLNTYTSFADMKKEIQNITQRNQGTSTWDALKNIRYFFTKGNGSRIEERVAQNLLLITDGHAKDTEDLNAVEYLRDKSISITAIGIGKDINKTELQKIAGNNRLFIESFDDLELMTTKRKVLNLLCTDSNCDIDIAFGFDVSRRTSTQTLFRPQVEPLVSAAIHRISMMGDLCCIMKDKITTRFGYRLVSGRDGSVLDDFGFEKYNEDVVKKLMLLRPTTLAFNGVLLDSFKEMLASSKAKAKVLIIFTDGLDDDIQRLMASSERLKQSGVSALLIVSLEGIMDVHQLEFGRGSGYMQPLTINMLNLGNALMKEIVIALRICCNVPCSCTGEDGPRGPPGSSGEKVKAPQF
uniref:Si:ch211-62a1.3 n=1 Tax=Sinocyclocheilus grahami TaxID=75366 RepID=A0A672RRK8_SINGR